MIIAQGAEAILRKEKDSIVKERAPKAYRLGQIDTMLRKSRTRQEARMLERLEKTGFPAPRVRNTDFEKMQIAMDFLEGPQLKEILHKNPKGLAREIGKKIGILHSNNIIHSDLTTSNMIHSKGRIHFIDFGLSFVSDKAEDKAVDLHLLDRALESKHHEIYEQCIKEALEGYKETNPEWKQVFQRLDKVRLRGRNKRK